MTGDLNVRLCDDAYTTCFPEGWRYVATVETASREDAEKVESAILYRAAAIRLDGRELVVATAPVLIAAAQEEAERLLPPGSWKLALDPKYEMHRREGLGRKLTPPAPEAPPAEPPAPAPVAFPGGEPVAFPPSEDDLEDAVADVLGGRALHENEFQKQKIEERPYQTEAIERCVAEVGRTGRGILQMACRCGKTRVAYGVIQRWMAEPATGHVLFLVPGLHLLRQTAQKLAAYASSAGHTTPEFLLVGSDPRPVALGPGIPQVSMTTDSEAIGSALSGPPRLVVCTYQSSPLLPDVFTHQVFDEAHRITGSADPERPFAAVLLNHKAPRGRLFVTATPSNEPKPVTMKDATLFGGVAYRYHLRQGIRAGYVNPYRLVFIGEDQVAPTDGDATAAHVLRASAECAKLLVFCRNIAHAEELQKATEDVLSGGAWPEAWGAPPTTYSAHSRMSSALVASTTQAFAAEDEAESQNLFTPEGVPSPNAPPRRILFNCRLFQEGVELPALNGVLFAAPRHAPRDIIQSVCRPLNRRDGLGREKPPSAVYLPVRRDASLPPDAPANLSRFSTIVPFADALSDEDPSFYEYLLDPSANQESLVEWAAARQSPPGTTPVAPSDFLAALRRVVRYGTSGSTKTDRLLRTVRIPWKVAFPRMKDVVERLRRYIKTTDELKAGEIRIPFHRWYKWVAEQYIKFSAGKPSALSPAQVADLETLPEWRTRGVEGPYPWRESLDYLERWLGGNGGIPPMVEINIGGFVGLDATPMERLSGTLTCINQSDGRRAKRVTLPEEKQKDLDDLCERWGLRWRKVREADGTLPVANKKYTGPPTFIQEAFERFKATYAAQKKAGAPDPYIATHFPDYPMKHKRQEIVGFDKDAQPGRWRTRKGRSGAAFPAN